MLVYWSFNFQFFNVFKLRALFGKRQLKIASYFYLPVNSCFEMKRPCFGYFFNKYCCSLVSYRPLPNAKPMAGKKAGKKQIGLVER